MWVFHCHHLMVFNMIGNVVKVENLDTCNDLQKL